MFIVENDKRTISDLYETIIERFVPWAETRQDIRFAAILGSRARTDHRADDWADLDVLLVTKKPQYYVDTAEWTEKMGKPVLTFVEETASGEQEERRVLYEGTLDVDYAIFPVSKIEELLDTQLQTFEEKALILSMAFGRGMRVLVDKDRLADKFRSIIPGKEAPKLQPPTYEEFIQAVNDFLYHCVWTTKHLMRGELWWALTCLNCHLPSLQLRMTEWQARATHGESYDTWFRGRFLETWANPEVIIGLRASFAHYDESDAFATLEASMNLFRQTSMVTAEKLNFQYPFDADKRISAWIKSQLSGRRKKLLS
jgi:aminoglycoside 6-adenylyltransferase